MKFPEIQTLETTDAWVGRAIRFVGIAFILGGLWGVVGALTHVPHFSLLVTLFGITIDMAGVAFIVAGYQLAMLHADGRNLALFLTYANLGALWLLSVPAMAQGNALDSFTLLIYRPDDLLLPVLVLVVRSLLEIGLILFLSSHRSRALFTDGK